jgi:hypothetical protein
MHGSGRVAQSFLRVTFGIMTQLSDPRGLQTLASGRALQRMVRS